MAHHRFEYVFELKNLSQPILPDPAVEADWRNPSLVDHQLLADLMLDSYRDTIDYDGETIADAISEVGSYFSGLPEDSTLLDSSWLGFMQNSLVCASLVGFWEDRNSPIISYVMTASQWKGKHLATSSVTRSLHSLAESNHTQVYAVITEGNVPSEQVFRHIGFERLAPIK